jgi:protein-disulfide isomerase
MAHLSVSKKILLSASVALLSLSMAGAALSAEAPTAKVSAEAPTAKVLTEALSKTEIEQVIHDYIMAHPETIMESVDQFQKKAQESRFGDAVEKNKDALFKDTSSPEIGNPKGDVTVVEFFDYNCHYCKDALPELKKMLEKDKKVRVIFKDFPILGPTSETASKWALAAHKQGKYFEFHKALMENKQPISDEVLEKIAKDVGLDLDKAKKAAEGTDVLIQIEKNRSLATNMGLSGTPAFVIGTEIVPGGMRADVMLKRIDAQRKGGK